MDENSSTALVGATLISSITPPLPFSAITPSPDLNSMLPAPASLAKLSTKLPYFIARNTRGSLPVYTDIRNGGTRHLVLVRNIDGNIAMLARELSQQLFPKGSRDASRVKVDIHHSRHLVITGGQWKTNVVEFLKRKGF